MCCPMKIMVNRTRTVLSLVTEEDLDILVKDGKVDKQQGAVLSQADLTAIMLLSSATLSKRTRKYQKGGREAASDCG